MIIDAINIDGLGNNVEIGENLEPAVQKFERVMAALRQGTERVPLLPKKERQKLLPAQEEKKGDLLDDSIPF